MTEQNGKSALFSNQTHAPIHKRQPAAGRQAFFSAPQRRRGSVVVECQSCDARTPVPIVELPIRLVPSFWIPGRPYSRWMWCPSCRRPGWCRIDWRAALG